MHVVRSNVALQRQKTPSTSLLGLWQELLSPWYRNSTCHFINFQILFLMGCVALNTVKCASTFSFVVSIPQLHLLTLSVSGSTRNREDISISCFSGSISNGSSTGEKYTWPAVPCHQDVQVGTSGMWEIDERGTKVRHIVVPVNLMLCSGKAVCLTTYSSSALMGSS